MIAYLKGSVIAQDIDSAVIDVQGVGYEVLCSANTLDKLSQNSSAQLFIYTHVREDALILYGFATQNEKELFLSLIKVNGVGPKLAIKILSGTSIENFLNLIEREDISGLSTIPKVGKKTAEQLVLALKGKLKLGGDEKSKTFVTGTNREIFSALVNLGFKENEVSKVLEDMPTDITFEEGVRKGLSSLSNNL